MFTLTLFRANLAVRRIEAEVTQQAYLAGWSRLSNQSAEWIPAHIEQIAQRFEGHRGSSSTLREQMTRLEDRLAKAQASADAHQDQLDLTPSSISHWTKSSRVLVIVGVTYLAGVGLDYWLGELSLGEWLSLAVAVALVAGPWALGIPVLSPRRARLAAWRAAGLVRRHKRQLHRLTQRLETLRHREAFIARWSHSQISALQQGYRVAFEAASKARERAQRLDQVAAPTITFADIPEPPSPKPTLYPMNGTRVDHPVDLIETGRD
ncbi:MAG: hypothetical protein MRJ68_11720 [Nitrospira sp.]|nr:hypothetical protein [Nitrospira sp.]